MIISSIATAWSRRRRELQLRRELRGVLRDAGIDEPMPMQEVCQRIGEIRGRPIVVVDWDFDAGDPYGCWCAGPSTDWIFVQAATSPAHKEHVIAHEFGHCWRRHSALDTDGGQAWPGGVLRRTCYDTEQEKDAETVATLLLQQSAAMSGVVAPGETERARTAQHALGDRVGWV